MLALPLDRTGDLTGTDGVLWKLARNTPYVPSPLLYDERLFFFAGNNAMLSVADARNGQVLVDAEGFDGVFGMYASPVAAAGRVYLVGRDGNAVVLKQADSIQILARNKLDEGIDASAAIVGKEMFLRGRKSLYCLAESDPSVAQGDVVNRDNKP